VCGRELFWRHRLWCPGTGAFLAGGLAAVGGLLTVAMNPMGQWVEITMELPLNILQMYHESFIMFWIFFDGGGGKKIARICGI
jgi:hypothetical protein